MTQMVDFGGQQTSHDAELAELRRRLQVAECDQRDLYFARLLGDGYFPTAQAALEAGNAFNLTFPHRYFIILSARPEAWGELFVSGEMDRRDSNFILRNTLEDGLPGTVHAADIQGKMIAIMNLKALPETGLRGILQDAQRILEVLETEYGITVTAAVSRAYESILDLPTAIEDIHRVYEYLALLGEDRPITSYDELTHAHMMPSPTTYLELEGRLLGCIRASDFSGADRVLHDLIQGEFGDAKPTIDTVRMRVYGVVNTLLYLMNDIRAVVGHKTVNKIDPGPRLTSAKTLEEIVSVMDDIFAQLESYAAQKRSTMTMPWVHEIKPYVDENFQDPNLGVSTVADHFGLSSTYCSKVFREHYGIRLLDYIQQKRLEAVKELLRTDKTLREIADQTGFTTTLTLSRAMKRYEGTTANKLREAMHAE